ncbi:MAG: hypothetical protein ACK4UN_20345 [Limisphaerales bacterium]
MVNRKGPVESGDRCPVITGSVTTMKRSLRQRFLGSFADLHLLDLTLSEAESMAWDTTFPHLFFPVLAEEKISKALAWAERQRALRACTSEFCFAA